MPLRVAPHMTRYAAVLLPLLLLACSPPRTQFSATASDSSYILADERDAEAVADAYRERVRLGLGSPFRVIETAAYDRRLTPEFREELLADLFERVLDGHTYEIGPTLPIAHYRVIEHAHLEAHSTELA